MPSRWMYAVCIAFMVIVATCGILLSAIFYAEHGRGPLTHQQQAAWSKIKGNTREEVLDILGKPHDIRDYFDDGEVWDYHGDLLGIVIYSLRFGPDGRVVSVWW